MSKQEDTNSVMLSGVVVSEPKFSNVGKNGDLSLFKARLEVAGKRKTFVPLIAWSDVADDMATHVVEGTAIKVRGRLTTGSYEKQDGTKVFTWDVVVEKWDMRDEADKPKPKATEQPKPTARSEAPTEPDDNGIPF